MKMIKSNNWFKKAQGVFVLDLEKMVPLPRNLKNPAFSKINKLCNGLLEEIPIKEMEAILNEHNMALIDDDGSSWSGMITGAAECGTDEARRQRVSISIAVAVSPDGNSSHGVWRKSKNDLHIIWCAKYQGDRRLGYEVVAYIT